MGYGMIYFNSRLKRAHGTQKIQAGVAQLVEQLICNQQVRGSSPFTSSIMEEFPSGQREQTVNLSAMPSVVRIHPLPPKNRLAFASLFFYPLRKQWHIINDSNAIVVSHQSVRTVYHHALACIKKLSQ